MSSLRDFHVFPNSLVMGPGLVRVGGSHIVGVNEAMATLTVGAAVSDPYWANTVLCINPSGIDGSTSIIDATGRHTLVAYGDAQIDTSLGYPTIITDGVGDYIAQTSLSDDWTFGTGDFCIEGFIQVGGLPTSALRPIVCLRYAAGSLFDNVVGMHYGKIQFSDGSTWHGSAVADYFQINGMRHFAVDRSSGTLRIFYEGEQEYSAVVNANIAGNRPLYLFKWDSTSDAFGGQTAGIRVTKGQSRYNSNFTPPSYPFPTA